MSDAHIRVVNCSPDSRTLTVSIGDTTQRVSYGEATGYETVPAGKTEVTVDSTDGDERGPLARATPRVKTNHSETVFILGSAQQNSLQAITLEDGSASVRPQYAMLRFVNAVPGSPSLDFRFAEPAVGGEEVLSRQISFGENGTYRKIDAGTRQFDFGINAREGYRQVLTAEKTFEGERMYTAVAVGRPESGEYDVLLLEDAPLKTPAE